MNLREVIGVALVGTGFLVLIDRSVASLFQLNGLFVAGVGLLAVVLGLNYFKQGREASRRSTPVADVEPRYEVPVPGDETDETLTAASGFSPTSANTRREFHDELRSVAVETLTARGDYPNEAAVETALRDGTWTDDDVAGWFLGDAGSPPLSVRMRGLLGADTEFSFAAKRTITALVEVSGVGLGEAADEQANPDDTSRADDAGSADDEADAATNGSRPDASASDGGLGGGRPSGGFSNGRDGAVSDSASDAGGDRTDDAPEQVSGPVAGATGSDARDVWRTTADRTTDEERDGA